MRELAELASPSPSPSGFNATKKEVTRTDDDKSAHCWTNFEERAETNSAYASMKIRGQKFLLHSHVEWVALIRDQRRCCSSSCPHPSEVKVKTELLSSRFSPSKVEGRLRVHVVSHEYAMLRLQDHNHAPLFELAPHQLRCFPSTGFADAFGPLGISARPAGHSPPILIFQLYFCQLKVRRSQTFRGRYQPVIGCGA